MKRPTPDGVNRRTFLVTTAGAGLILAVGESHAETDPAIGPINAFVAIGTDGRVVVTVKHLEMGQGVATGLLMGATVVVVLGPPGPVPALGWVALLLAAALAVGALTGHGQTPFRCGLAIAVLNVMLLVLGAKR